MRILGSHPTVTNCSFIDNSGKGSGIRHSNAFQLNATVTNCIFWDETPDEIVGGSGTLNVRYSDVQGGYSGTGNIDAEPLFVDADGPDDDPSTFEDNDYRLLSGSPGIDAGDNTAVPEDITTDLDGNPRFVDDPDTPNTGNWDGANSQVDMGAYEFQLLSCLGDTDGNLVVDVDDLVTVMENWGCMDPGPCPGDLNGDGVVDVNDLVDVFTGWGACPICSRAPDCDANGLADICEIQGGSADDCNGNGVADECEEPDCNSNFVPDECDIADGTSQDCNGNGVPDECEEPDCNGNGVPDECEPDCNGNGVPDECDIADGTSLDCNGNGIPDECEGPDCNGNGIPDECEEPDCNGNGVPDECDIADGKSFDCNENGVPDECEPDYDGNGVPDECEADCNANGLPDDLDIAIGISDDANGNGIPDECDPDCNANDVPDDLDIANGTSRDADGNGIPDECTEAFSASSGVLSPIGTGSNQTWMVTAPPDAADGLVTLAFEVAGDFGDPAQQLHVQVNGLVVGSVFGATGSDCPAVPDTDSLLLDAATFNDLLAGGDLTVVVGTGAGVDPDACLPDPSTVEITLDYLGAVPP